MSEDDRAAKAARAKALLKKRQREKAGGVPTPLHSGVASPTSPSRTLSPAPQESIEEDRTGFGDVFTRDDSDTSWLSSLPRATSPPPFPSHVPQSIAIASPLPSQLPRSRINMSESEIASLEAELKRLQASESDLKRTELLLEEQRAHAQVLQERLQILEVEKAATLQNDQQTISLLVSEKSSLVAELQRLEDVESKFHALENHLEEEHRKLMNLDEKVYQLQADKYESTKIVQESQTREKELFEKFREQERELQLAKSSIADLKQETAEHQRKVRELEEQIQSDDRVERLENSLKNTQERADELEFQLSKLRQTHTALKVERDEIDSQRLLHSKHESELETELSELQGLHATVLQQLAVAISEKDVLTQEKFKAKTEVESTQKTLSELQAQLAEATTIIALNTKQSQVTQLELKSAIRRAKDAEKTQMDLQTEGIGLMRSLEEMRPKIVELTGVKLEMSETISSLELDLRNSRSTISQLQSQIQEVTEHKDELEGKFEELLSQREKERSLALSDSSELQEAYAKLQEELDTADASLHNLELERSNHHQEVARLLEEIEDIKSSSQATANKMSVLGQELDAVRNARNEAQDFLERAQNEVESLRTNLSARDEEIEDLRKVIATPTKSAAARSLDDELVSSLRQQHALDLSSAQSQIRALENSVFDANARCHTLQKQVRTLEDQLSQSHSRPTSRLGRRSFSPIPSVLRPSSRMQNNSDIPRSSFGSHHRPTSGLVPPLSRSIFDQSISAETRHKRLISLSMLKARIDSEVGATISRPSSRASSARALSPVPSESGSRPGSPHSHTQSHAVHRPQFLDDSHVFWCHSCSGDLVIL